MTSPTASSTNTVRKCKHCGGPIAFINKGWGHLPNDVAYCCNVGKLPSKYGVGPVRAEPISDNEIIDKLLAKYDNGGVH